MQKNLWQKFPEKPLKKPEKPKIELYISNLYKV